MRVHKSRILRRVFLPLLARFNPGDITIRHHYTGDRIRIHSYHHKGYWFHGRQREAATMQLFRRFLSEGATVLDVGGHTGYVALYLASLVGPEGQVFVFEPGENNLPYLRHNTRGKANVTVVEKGAGSRNERRVFYIEGLTGQNNSFVHDFEVLETNKARAYAAGADVRQTVVDVVALDEFCREEAVRPGFIKIDVEGFEREVLQGASSLLQNVHPMLMVEIQADHAEVMQLAGRHGYRLFTPEGKPLRRVEDFIAQHINTFWLHEDAHAEALARFDRLFCCESRGKKCCIGHSLQPDYPCGRHGDAGILRPQM
ncbi:MAG: FkbM family methyltransferase [Pirellulales bacterium]|nr:FkbM family methyltransferase [Pirellulales bacterium]